METLSKKINTHLVNQKATKFYKWFRGLGGNLSQYDAVELIKKLQPEESLRTFKTNPEKIKKELNHKFNF